MQILQFILHKKLIKIAAVVLLISPATLFAQDSMHVCKVNVTALAGTYVGECKQGWAQGKGEAKGIQRYVGSFKFGLPDGKGTYYYNDHEYFIGNFQDGIKEGKGEMHYQQGGKADSIVKGYWSADEYRGKNYKTYNIAQIPFFDRVEVEPTDGTGNTLTIEITTTTGSPRDGQGYVLEVADLLAMDGSFIRKVTSNSSNFKFSVTYELSKFPSRLQIIFSNGRMADIELYKRAKWMIRLYVNK